MSESALLGKRLRDAASYTDIFINQDTINEDYRRLARLLHPDVAEGMEEEFNRLSVFKSEALLMAKEGRFGQRQVMNTITTRKARHEVIRLYAEGDLANLYVAATHTNNGADSTLIKVAKSPRDNDLLVQEARALKTLNTDDKMARAIPVLVDTFLYNEGRRRANALEFYANDITLTDLYHRWPTPGLDARHVAWIFRRTLMALGYAHEQGLVHGAVLPQHLLIGAADHSVRLIDWCYSVVIDEESKTNVKAMVPMYESWYPAEVKAKEPASAATDLYMAARTMTYMLGATPPKPFAAFFRGCALTKQNMRPQNAWLLLEEFDSLLKEIGEPFYPKRWVELVVPSGTT